MSFTLNLQRLKPKLAALTLMLLLCLSGPVGHAGALSPVVADAATSGSKAAACQGVGLSGADCGSGASDINTLLKSVVNIITGIVGVVAVIMIIVGGMRYITSGGDSNKVSSAKSTIIYALIGLVVVALAQLIVHFVILGSNSASTQTKQTKTTTSTQTTTSP